jgi:hypothetical protein
MIALAGLCLLPRLTGNGRDGLLMGSENEELLRQMRLPKRKKKEL